MVRCGWCGHLIHKNTILWCSRRKTEPWNRDQSGYKVQCPEYLLLKIISIFYLVQYAIYGFCNMVTKVSKSRCVWYSRYLRWNLRGGIAKPNGCGSLTVLFPVEQKSMLLRFICSCSAPRRGHRECKLFPCIHTKWNHIKLNWISSLKSNETPETDGNIHP